MNNMTDASPRFAAQDVSEPKTPMNDRMEVSEMKTPPFQTEKVSPPLQATPSPLVDKKDIPPPLSATKLKSERESSGGTISDQSANSLMVKR